MVMSTLVVLAKSHGRWLQCWQRAATGLRVETSTSCSWSKSGVRGVETGGVSTCLSVVCRPLLVAVTVVWLSVVKCQRRFRCQSLIMSSVLRKHVHLWNDPRDECKENGRHIHLESTALVKGKRTLTWWCAKLERQEKWKWRIQHFSRRWWRRVHVDISRQGICRNRVIDLPCLVTVLRILLSCYFDDDDQLPCQDGLQVWVVWEWAESEFASVWNVNEMFPSR